MTRRIATLAFHLDPAHKAVRLLPAGTFRSADGSGRPVDAPAWHIDSAAAAQIIARANARTDRKVVDYEHQTIKASQNGQPAPAAGWIDALEWRAPAGSEPGGIYMIPDWTDKAAAMIAAKEYRYISPVFTYDKDGRVLDLLHAGLTNFAGLDGLADLAALSAHFNLNQEKSMKILLSKLGLNENATEDQAIAALAAIMARADSAESRIATLTAQAEQTPDPAKYVTMAAHSQIQNALAALTAQFEQKERDAMMAAALADGRILAAQDAYWRAQPVAALKAYLDVAQPLAALVGTQTGGKEPAGATDASLDAAQIAICSAMGIDPKAFAKTLAK